MAYAEGRHTRGKACSEILKFGDSEILCYYMFQFWMRVLPVIRSANGPGTPLPNVVVTSSYLDTGNGNAGNSKVRRQSVYDGRRLRALPFMTRDRGIASTD